ncbi:cation channel sperm-associated protein 1 [Hemicordylus capensis]|uniref:cation channel sperm-associated protein 1 n=1 Tax=Hemicordylus capensis TaxID=884348 RepID=UPI0023044827|nr:cation channel sperm-associated protein 1 [Hemicordylus capensis]
MDYLTVPAIPSLPQVEKTLTPEEQASFLSTAGPGALVSYSQVSGISSAIPPSQEGSTVLSVTSAMPMAGRSGRLHGRGLKLKHGSRLKSQAEGQKVKVQRPRRRYRKRKRRKNLKEFVIWSWGKILPHIVFVRKILYTLTHAFLFDIFIVSVVAVNTLMLVAQTFAVVEIRGEWFFSALDSMIVSVYVAEAILKIIALGFKYFQSSWNFLDFIIMVMAVLDFMIPLFIVRQGTQVGFLRILKIFKGIRALRAFRFILNLRWMKNVKEVISTFVLSCKSIGAIILLMFTFLFMCSVVMHDMFRRADPKKFGDLFKTIFTLFQLFTLDDWSLIYLTCHAAGYWYIIIFLIFYILVQYFLLLNLMIAVLVDNFQMALITHELNKQKEQKVVQLQEISEEEVAVAKTSAEKAKEKEQEKDEEFVTRMIKEKYGTLELSDKDWKLLYLYFQLMTSIENNQQQLQSEASTSDKIIDTFFETTEDDYPSFRQ